MKNWINKQSMMTMTLLVSLSASAQTICNDNGTVTFNYHNAQAKKVAVDVQFAGKHDMTFDKKTGIWSVTLGPAAPDMYPYHFEVDGLSIMDPLCKDYFPNEGFKNSLLEMKSNKGKLAHDILPVGHGRIEYIHYYSKNLGATNNAIVYTPSGYYDEANKDKKYPVFYLISGTTDTEEVYYKVGRMNYILDNLIAEGKAQEMIIVLPYGNPTKLKDKVPADARAQGDLFSNDLNDDLMPYIEANYRTINDADHRAIGGFSRGGNQALYNGLRHLDKFSYLCSYSSFTSTDIPDVYEQADSTNSKINLLWLGVGTDDFLYGTARDYMEFLDKHGIRAAKTFTYDKFGHTWMNAKYFLAKTLPLLFNKKASRLAMEYTVPTRKATGKEKPFNLEVMSRLFPKPIVSPEYGDDHSVTFRIKAPEAQEVHVNLIADGENKSLKMTKDTTGVWSVTTKLENIKLPETLDKAVTHHAYYKYFFDVDGMHVVDPNDMYLADDNEEKYSIALNPDDEYYEPNMGDIAYGKVVVDPNNNTATYYPANKYWKAGEAPRRIVLNGTEPIQGMTRLGGIASVADRLLANGAEPFIITVRGNL